ncbi:MAG: DUF3307 domain-containing protein [Bacteroidota bacterium]
MEQLILHGIGDYLIQTDKWANGKKLKGLYGFLCCLKHCVTYSLPFLIIGSWKAVLAICVSHFIIDRTRIIEYLLAWKNGVYKTTEIKPNSINYMFTAYTVKSLDISNFGFAESKPKFMSIWLFIITDNIVHLICNYLSLKYL